MQVPSLTSKQPAGAEPSRSLQAWSLIVATPPRSTSQQGETAWAGDTHAASARVAATTKIIFLIASFLSLGLTPHLRYG